MSWKKSIYAGNLLILAGALCALEQHLDAQSTFGSIAGTVRDASGGAVPEVTLTVKNLDDQRTDSATPGRENSLWTPGSRCE
jgi:hypothetical protein